MNTIYVSNHGDDKKRRPDPRDAGPFLAAAHDALQGQPRDAPDGR